METFIFVVKPSDQELFVRPTLNMRSRLFKKSGANYANRTEVPTRKWG